MTTASAEINLNPHQLAQSLAKQIFIGGRLIPSTSAQHFTLKNPATGQPIADIAEGSANDIDRAVQAAAEVQPEWAAISARDRGKHLIEMGRILNEHSEELARLVALESGKALRTECRPEASTTGDVFAFFGGLTPELKGETIPLKSGALTYTIREPIGVVGVILPWNAPLMLMAFKVAPALAAGNTVVIKTAEETPLAVLRAVQLISKALPDGTLNVVSGYGPVVGAALVEHPTVNKVTFTGSVETGTIIYQAAAKKLIPVTLELGGKSPMIVMQDADIDQAVAGAVAGMRFTRQGQSCTAASRMIIHESIHDEFVEKLAGAVKKLKMGDPLDEDTDIGTIISQAQYDKVKSYISLAEQEPQHTLIRCADLPTASALEDGFYLQPILITGVSNNSVVAQEEIFGPITCIIKFSEFEEALAIANDSCFGLAATIWTRDLKTAMDATSRLEVGLVQVNQNQVAGPNISYGGTKLSGIGKELSLESMLEHFTHKKSVIINFEQL